MHVHVHFDFVWATLARERFVSFSKGKLYVPRIFILRSGGRLNIKNKHWIPHPFYNKKGGFNFWAFCWIWKLYSVKFSFIGVNKVDPPSPLEKILDPHLIKNISACICCKTCLSMYGYYHFYNIKVLFYSLYKDIIN